MKTTQELLLDREIKGLKFICYYRIFFVAVYVGITWIVAKSTMERVVVALINLISFLFTMYFFYLLKKKKHLLFIGIASAIIDVVILACLPYIWHQSVGGDAVSRSYVLKSPSHIAVSYVILIIHSFAIRPLYPIIVAAGLCLSSVGHLLYALSDPRTVISADYVTFMLGSTINMEFFVTNLFTFIAAGFILAFYTYNSRKLIFEAINLEKAQMQVSRYFSPKIFEKIAGSDDTLFSLIGRKQEVAVMFTDIRDFTALSETMKPEEVVELLKSYHAKMVNIIFQNGGTLDKFIGDGIMATFGTPDSKPDDAYRAVWTGLEMRKALQELNRERETKGLNEIKMGIGIHFGNVIVGNIGTESRMEYTVIGDTVNLASRIESKCKELKTDFLISDSVRSFLDDKIKTIDRGKHSVKGKTEAVNLFEVIGI